MINYLIEINKDLVAFKEKSNYFDMSTLYWEKNEKEMTSLKLSNEKTQRILRWVVLSAVKLNEPALVEHKFIELNGAVEKTHLTVFYSLFK